MALNSTTGKYVGVGATKTPVQFTIPDGTDGSAVDAADFEREYMFVRLRCADCSHIQASTTLSLAVGYFEGETLHTLCETDDPSTPLSLDLPTTGSFDLLLSGAMGARFIKPTLSQVASGGAVELEFIGFDPVTRR